MSGGRRMTEMQAWIVTVQWAGDPSRIRGLLTELAHLEPRLEPGTAQVELTVTAESASEARSYVRTTLTRGALTDVTAVVAARVKPGGRP